MMLPLRLIVILQLTATVVTGLQCPSCSYLKLAPNADVPSFARPMVDSLFDAVQDEKCANVLSGPTTGVKEDTCVEEAGKTSRCSFYNGSLTVKVLAFNVPLQLYQRGCFYSLTGNVPKDGCYDRNAIAEDKSFLQESLKQVTSLFENMDAVTFTGQRCICSETYTCGAISGHFFSLSLLLLAVVLSMIVL